MTGFFDKDYDMRQRIRALGKQTGATPTISPNDGSHLVARRACGSRHI